MTTDGVPPMVPSPLQIVGEIVARFSDPHVSFCMEQLARLIQDVHTKAFQEGLRAGTATMTLNEYQEKAHETAVFSDEHWLEYIGLKLCSEAGEFSGKVGKCLFRGDKELDFRELDFEIGDVLWYIAEYFSRRGLTLEEGARLNLEKLQDRKTRGTLKGAGDHR